MTQLNSLRNAKKLDVRSTAEPENSENSDPGEDDEELFIYLFFLYLTWIFLVYSWNQLTSADKNKISVQV